MSKLVGYARVSTQDQDLKLQIDALLKSSKKFPVFVKIQQKLSSIC